MKKGLTAIIVVGVLLAGTLGYAYVKKQADVSAGKDIPAMEVPVMRGDVVVRAVADGSASARLSKLRSEVSGRVTEVYVTSGQQVTEGDVILRLDNTDHLAKLRAAEQKAEDARNALERARRKYEELLGLELQKVENQKSALDAIEFEYKAMVELAKVYTMAYSKHELELKRIAYESAKMSYEGALRAYDALIESPSYIHGEFAALKQAEEAVQTARKELDNTRVSADITGQIAQLMVEVGSMINSGTEVAALAYPGPLTVVGQVFELDLAGIEVGSVAHVTFEAAPWREFAGSVLSIDMLPASRNDQYFGGGPSFGMSGPVNYKVTVQLQEESEEIRSGMSCRLAFEKEAVLGVLVIPRMAVERAEDRSFVRVKADSGEVVERDVELGMSDGQIVEVVSGLTEGDVVLVVPQFGR